jgi:DNA-binding NarL/FixJ family response regulator
VSAAPLRVLVVDDDPDFRFLARLALSRPQPFEVVGEGADAVQAVERARLCAPDLILLDCTMPGPDPLEALGALRAAAPAAEIVLASGHSPSDLRLAARVAGAVGFVSKDVPPRRLAHDLDVVSRLVGAIRGRAGTPVRATSLDAALSSVGAARRFVASAVGALGSQDLEDAVVLATSEVVTNAVVHAASEVSLLVRMIVGGVRVEVSDASQLQLERTAPGLLAESGRGLAIVDALATRWGVDPLPGGGKTVWFEVAGVPPAGAGT